MSNRYVLRKIVETREEAEELGHKKARETIVKLQPIWEEILTRDAEALKDDKPMEVK